MRGAGSGGRPKPEGQSNNRHKPVRSPLEVPAGRKLAESGPPKPLLALNAVGRRVWALIWASPSASQWRDGDLPSLSRMVWLQQTSENWLDPRLLAEMRQLEDRFGLNPYARRQMKWEETGSKQATVPAAGKVPSDTTRRAKTLELLTSNGRKAG